MTSGNPNSINEAEPQHSRTPCVVIVGGGFGDLDKMAHLSTCNHVETYRRRGSVNISNSI